VRRGTELTTAYFRDANKPETYVKPHGGLVVLLAITIVVFTVMLLAVS
jgi:hypothetical protein